MLVTRQRTCKPMNKKITPDSEQCNEGAKSRWYVRPGQSCCLSSWGQERLLSPGRLSWGLNEGRRPPWEDWGEEDRSKLFCEIKSYLKRMRQPSDIAGMVHRMVHDRHCQRSMPCQPLLMKLVWVRLVPSPWLSLTAWAGQAELTPDPRKSHLCQWTVWTLSMTRHHAAI